MNVATWNVNGIRAREVQFLEWTAREQPDVARRGSFWSSRET